MPFCRSVFHPEAPIHETGHQLLQTGRLSRSGLEWPHCGAVVGKLRPASQATPAWVVLPAPLGHTGVSVSHGQSAGFLGQAHDPFLVRMSEAGGEWTVAGPSAGLDTACREGENPLLGALDSVQRVAERQARTGDIDPGLAELCSPRAKRAFDLAGESDQVRDRYGRNTFGQSCLLARRLVQHGVRLVTVNMFDTVFGQITWDCHANGGDLRSTLDDYRTTLCPMLDQAYTALLDDLEALGLLGDTLVLAMGEFGRTPKLNARGGRDHWPGVWSMLMAGGGVRGGQVIGASDRHGEEPRDRPVQPAEIVATVYHSLGIDPATSLPGPNGQALPLVDAAPVAELF